jgi:hypothetical protein
VTKKKRIQSLIGYLARQNLMLFDPHAPNIDRQAEMLDGRVQTNPTFSVLRSFQNQNNSRFFPCLQSIVRALSTASAHFLPKSFMKINEKPVS